MDGELVVILRNNHRSVFLSVCYEDYLEVLDQLHRYWTSWLRIGTDATFRKSEVASVLYVSKEQKYIEKESCEYCKIQGGCHNV